MILPQKIVHFAIYFDCRGYKWLKMKVSQYFDRKNPLLDVKLYELP